MQESPFEKHKFGVCKLALGGGRPPAAATVVWVGWTLPHGGRQKWEGVTPPCGGGGRGLPPPNAVPSATSSPWSTRRHVFLSEREDVSSCSVFSVFLLNKKTRLLVEKEDMPSCWTRRHVFLLDKRTCLLVRHVFFSNKKTCLLEGQEDMSSCSMRGHVFYAKRSCQAGG